MSAEPCYLGDLLTFVIQSSRGHQALEEKGFYRGRVQDLQRARTIESSLTYLHPAFTTSNESKSNEQYGLTSAVHKDLLS